VQGDLKNKIRTRRVSRFKGEETLREVRGATARDRQGRPEPEAESMSRGQKSKKDDTQGGKNLAQSVRGGLILNHRGNCKRNSKSWGAAQKEIEWDLGYRREGTT